MSSFSYFARRTFAVIWKTCFLNTFLNLNRYSPTEDTPIGVNHKFYTHWIIPVQSQYSWYSSRDIFEFTEGKMNTLHWISPHPMRRNPMQCIHLALREHKNITWWISWIVDNTPGKVINIVWQIKEVKPTYRFIYIYSSLIISSYIIRMV